MWVWWQTEILSLALMLSLVCIFPAPLSHMHVCMHACLCMHACVCVHACMCLCECMCMYVCSSCKGLNEVYLS